MHPDPGDQPVDVPPAGHPAGHRAVPPRAVEVGQGQALRRRSGPRACRGPASRGCPSAGPVAAAPGARRHRRRAGARASRPVSSGGPGRRRKRCRHTPRAGRSRPPGTRASGPGPAVRALHLPLVGSPLPTIAASANAARASEYIGTPADRTRAARGKKTDPIALSYADQRALRAQPEPDRDHGRRDAGQRLHPLRQRAVRHAGRRHRAAQKTGRDRQPLQQAQRHPRRTGSAASTSRNFTIQQAEFNALYVLETDGFVIDHVTARGNDEYGILAFASDHGLIQRIERLLQRRLRLLPRLGIRPERRQPELQADPLRDRDPPQQEPPQHARLQRHGRQLGARARQRVLRQRDRHRHGLAVPRPPRACRRTTRAGTTTRSTATTRTGTRGTSTPASAPSR